LEAEIWEGWSAKDIPHPHSPVGGFGGGPAPGIIFPSLKDFNEYLQKENFKKIDIVGRCGGTFRWSFNKNFQVGICGGGFFGSSSTKDAGKNVKEVMLEGRGGVFLAAYRIPRSRGAVAVGVGMGGFGGEFRTVTTNEEGKDVKYKRFLFGGPMIQLFIEGTYYIAPIFGVGISVSYIWAKSDEVKLGGEDALDVDEVDFSGVMVTLGPRFHF
jgi:hypothetical protein